MTKWCRWWAGSTVGLLLLGLTEPALAQEMATRVTVSGLDTR